MHIYNKRHQKRTNWVCFNILIKYPDLPLKVQTHQNEEVFVQSLAIVIIYYYLVDVGALYSNLLSSQIKEVVGKHPDQIGKPLLKARLSDKQWDNIHRINISLADEYKTRREMLLKRLDVTIQSFMWSDKAKV